VGPLVPPGNSDYYRPLADARRALGEQTFARLWDEGRAMSLEQAVACARGHGAARPDCAGRERQEPASPVVKGSDNADCRPTRTGT
jgi:hypothetical protein